MSVQSVLIRLANAFIIEVTKNLGSGEYPSGEDRAGRNYSQIEETIERKNPVVRHGKGEIDIFVGSEQAPYTKMYEFGKEAYDIAPGKNMAFERKYWPQYKPPPPAPLFFVFPQVTHPEFAGRPFIKPVVDDFNPAINKALTRDEVKKLLFRDKPRQEVW